MDLSTGSPWETVKLTALSRDRHLFPLLLAEARDLATRGQAGKVVVYTAWGVEWKPFGVPRAKRELRSVVLGRGVSERIEEDLRAFLGRGKWYAERGMLGDESHLLRILGFLTLRDRDTVQTRLPPARPSRERKDVFHTSSRREAVVQHLRAEPLATRTHGRQTHPSAHEHT